MIRKGENKTNKVEIVIKHYAEKFNLTLIQLNEKHVRILERLSEMFPTQDLLKAIDSLERKPANTNALARQLLSTLEKIKAKHKQEELMNDKEEKMNYENLSVWQKSVELTKKIYQIHLPKDTELQLKLTALSITSNIVKGVTLDKQYLLTALHSLIELETLLTVLEYSELSELINDVKEIKRELLNVMSEE